MPEDRRAAAEQYVESVGARASRSPALERVIDAPPDAARQRPRSRARFPSPGRAWLPEGRVVRRKLRGTHLRTWMLLGFVFGQRCAEISERPLFGERSRLEEDDRDLRVANLDPSEHVRQEAGRGIGVLQQVAVAVLDDESRTRHLGELRQLQNQGAV